MTCMAVPIQAHFSGKIADPVSVVPIAATNPAMVVFQFIFTDQDSRLLQKTR